nr:RE1-silencing transcription factor B-like [Penaeus vannamei]
MAYIIQPNPKSFPLHIMPFYAHNYYISQSYLLKYKFALVKPEKSYLSLWYPLSVNIFMSSVKILLMTVEEPHAHTYWREALCLCPLFLSCNSESGSEKSHVNAPPRCEYNVRLSSSYEMAVGRGATGGEKTTPSVAKLRQCPYCSYSTTVTTNLKNHLCTHTKEKPYACDRCSYSAITKQTLEDHIRTHTGERPFSCPYCPYNAINKKRLKRHVIKHSVNTLNF